MTGWLRELRYDPITPLLSSGNEAICHHVQRDLLGEDPGLVAQLWELPAVDKLLKRQEPDGSFKYPGRRTVTYPPHHYGLLETWKQFRFLIEQYGFSKEHPACSRAAEFLFSCQTSDGDIRGFIGDQYATYYTGAILGLLSKAGYEDDPRTRKGFDWLLSMRQDDGGWTVPIGTAKRSREEMLRLTSERATPVEPERSKPFSHNWTGMVLRAFAAHPVHRKTQAARAAANLLKTRFFQPDVYSSYRAARYWTRFQFPFWWNHLVAALDSISCIEAVRDDPDIDKGLAWFVAHQEKDGLWRLSHEAPGSRRALPAEAREMRLWVALAICRILQRYDA
ncbi:MAG: prenyltransferase/squalene oxidase repeat-containing protein [Planctomycetota bacterium]|jgi:hypothetical protein